MTKLIDEPEKLEQLFDRMVKLAKENHQSVPRSFFISDDGNTAYAEIDGNNPLVLAILDENGYFRSDF